MSKVHIHLLSFLTHIIIFTFLLPVIPRVFDIFIHSFINAPRIIKRDRRFGVVRNFVSSEMISSMFQCFMLRALCNIIFFIFAGFRFYDFHNFIYTTILQSSRRVFIAAEVIFFVVIKKVQVVDKFTL